MVWDSLARLLTARRARLSKGGGQTGKGGTMLHGMLKADNADTTNVKASRHGAGSDKKQLRWMIENPPEGSVTMTITPAMAEEMLAYNDRNRPLSAPTIRAYASQMAEGKWQYTRQPLIFSANKRLIDGQHRLRACIDSGCAFRADVVFGAPDEAFSFIDIGKKRTGGDIFAINGVKNYVTVAAAVPWVVLYDEERSMRNVRQHKMTPDELYQEFLKHPGIEDSANMGLRVCDAKLAGAGLMTAMHYICAQKSRRAADEFFTHLADGIGFESKKDPIYKLHKVLQDNRAALSENKLSYRRIATYTIKAWNKWRTGEELGQLKMADNERFPRAR